MTPPERKGANSSALPSADPSKTLVFYHLFVEYNADIPRVSNLSRHQLSHLDPHHHQPWITENWCGEGDIGAASWNTFECKLNGFEADSFRFDLSCFPSFSILRPLTASSSTASTVCLRRRCLSRRCTTGGATADVCVPFPGGRMHTWGWVKTLVPSEPQVIAGIYGCSSH